VNNPEAAVKAAVHELLGYTGSCTCHGDYTARSLTDPDCHWHIVPNEEAARDVLQAALPHLLEPIKELCKEADRGQQSYGSMYGKVTTWQLRDIMEGMLKS
jgi:hypothetical protein